jgi:hypothetical protein
VEAASSGTAQSIDQQRETGVLLIAACIIAPIRLRGEPIRPSPKLTATVAEAISLARTVLRELQRA